MRDILTHIGDRACRGLFALSGGLAVGPWQAPAPDCREKGV
jgi:hypothetical protein